VNTLDKIAELWAEGLTTAVIGERLGIPKNSVCRLAFHARREGDARFPARAFAIPKKPKKPKSKPLLMRPAMPRRKRPSHPEPKPRSMPPLIYELNPNECRYPVTAFEGGRGDHRFCAAPQVAGSPYCAKHHELCQAVARPRVRHEQ
jgi:GcrA cell cycle regulator